MSFLLDTNVLSELRKGPRASANVVSWEKSTRQSALFTSVIVIAELRRGARARARKDAEGGAALNLWIARTIATFAERILPIDLEVAESWADIMIPDTRSAFDALIAATALVHRLTLVTRNVRDFAGMGIDLLDPWAHQV